MAMYLDEVPVYTIMMIGRWSSDAFLKSEFQKSSTLSKKRATPKLQKKQESKSSNFPI